jgi:hypothetical protein
MFCNSEILWNVYELMVIELFSEELDNDYYKIFYIKSIKV